MIRLGGQRCVSDQRGHLAMETQGEGCSSGEVTQDLPIANVKIIFVCFNDPLHSPHHHITKGSAIWGCSFDFDNNLCFHPGMWLAPGLSKVSLVSWLREILTYSIVKSIHRSFLFSWIVKKRRQEKEKFWPNPPLPHCFLRCLFIWIGGLPELGTWGLHKGIHQSDYDIKLFLLNYWTGSWLYKPVSLMTRLLLGLGSDSVKLNKNINK